MYTLYRVLPLQHLSIKQGESLEIRLVKNCQKFLSYV